MSSIEKMFNMALDIDIKTQDDDNITFSRYVKKTNLDKKKFFSFVKQDKILSKITDRFYSLYSEHDIVFLLIIFYFKHINKKVALPFVFNDMIQDDDIFEYFEIDDKIKKLIQEYCNKYPQDIFVGCYRTSEDGGYIYYVKINETDKTFSIKISDSENEFSYSNKYVNFFTDKKCHNNSFVFVLENNLNLFVGNCVYIFESISSITKFTSPYITANGVGLPIAYDSENNIYLISEKIILKKSDKIDEAIKNAHSFLNILENRIANAYYALSPEDKLSLTINYPFYDFLHKYIV